MYKIIAKKNGKYLATDGENSQTFDSPVHASPWLIELAFNKRQEEITLFDIDIVEEGKGV